MHDCLLCVGKAIRFWMALPFPEASNGGVPLLPYLGSLACDWSCPRSVSIWLKSCWTFFDEARNGLVDAGDVDLVFDCFPGDEQPTRMKMTPEARTNRTEGLIIAGTPAGRDGFQPPNRF